MPESKRKDSSSPPRGPFARLSPLTVWLGAVLAAFFALGPGSVSARGRGRSGNSGGRRGGGQQKPRRQQPRAPQPRRGPQQPRGPGRSGRSGINPRTGGVRGTRSGQTRGGRRATVWGNREEDRDLYRTWGLFLPDLGMGQGYGWGFPRDAAGNLLTVDGAGNPFPVPMAPDGSPLFRDPAGNPLPPTDPAGNPLWVTPTGQQLGLPADPAAVAAGTVQMSSAGGGGQTSAPKRRSLRRR